MRWLCENSHNFIWPGDAGRGDGSAEEEPLTAHLFIAIGSSLVVYPAAGFPEMAARNDTRLIILNREPTGLDPYADLVLHREIGVTLGEAVGNN